MGNRNDDTQLNVIAGALLNTGQGEDGSDEEGHGLSTPPAMPTSPPYIPRYKCYRFLCLVYEPCNLTHAFIVMDVI